MRQQQQQRLTTLTTLLLVARLLLLLLVLLQPWLHRRAVPQPPLQSGDGLHPKPIAPCTIATTTTIPNHKAATPLLEDERFELRPA